MSYIGSELRRLRRENVRLNRKLALQRMPGKVIERDQDRRMVRLEIGEDPATGEKIKSPWVRVTSVSAGKFKLFVLPSVGEPMYLESASGVIGADSVATWGTFDDESKHPTQDKDELVLENDKARLSMMGERLKLTVGESEVEHRPDQLRVRHGKGRTVHRPKFVKHAFKDHALFVTEDGVFSTIAIQVADHPEPNL